MKTKRQEAIYRGIWPGLGTIYNIKVEPGYTTIIVKPGEDLKKRTKDTQEKFWCFRNELLVVRLELACMV